MAQVSEEVRKARETVDKLNKRTEEISNVVSTIQGISDQTNLLALNACLLKPPGQENQVEALPLLLMKSEDSRLIHKKRRSKFASINSQFAKWKRPLLKKYYILVWTMLNECPIPPTITANSLNEASNYVDNVSNMMEQVSSASEEQGSVANENQQ